METVSAAISILASLPQCIQSAKELYDLRERYKGASVLITAIYSESMVIAASLSQVQNLLQHDALLQKPQLLETFDRALTGCRVVYGCLEEEVRGLVEKVEHNDLRSKDRAKFLWKEDTFRELLTQIRGQQSALSLLIQGLQMESMADIRKLVEDNSSKLDQVVKRSKTLRQSHPRIKVPDSMLSYHSGMSDAADAESISKYTQFDFDDEVVNSKSYRRAMNRYIMNYDLIADMKEPVAVEIEVAEENSTEMGTVQESGLKRNPIVAVRSQQLTAQFVSKAEEDVSMILPKSTFEGSKRAPDQSPEKEKTVVSSNSLERDLLPYNTRLTSSVPYLTPVRAGTFDTTETKVELERHRPPLRSYSEGSPIVPETSPPLPPRHTSGSQVPSHGAAINLEKGRSKSSDEILDASDAGSILSRVSEASTHTIYEPLQQNQPVPRKPIGKPLTLARKTSHAVMGSPQIGPIIPEPEAAASTFESGEMHVVWLSIVEAERNFLDRMTRLRKTFYDNIIRQWPVLEHHMSVVLIGEQLAAMSKKFLWLPMEQQLLESDGAICDPVIFEIWTTKVQRIFREYCQTLPHAIEALRVTQSNDGKFTPFVNTLGLSIAYFGKSWEDYLRLPVTELSLYVESVRTLISIATEFQHPDGDAEAQRLTQALSALDWLKTIVTTVLEESQSREDMQILERRLYTVDSDILSKLSLLDTRRRMRHQGSMAMKLKSKGSWHAVHVVLLDNYLFWGKVKTQKKATVDKIMVLDAPIPISELDVSLPCDQSHFQKATIFDEVPRNSIQCIIMIQRKNVDSKPHMLGSPTYQERRVWMDHFEAILGSTT